VNSLTQRLLLYWLVLIAVLVSCTAAGAPVTDVAFRQRGTGRQKDGAIAYRLAGGHVFRVEARDGATPEDVSAALDHLAPGSDEWLNLAPDGSVLLTSSSRFASECRDWPCLTLVARDLGSASVVRAGGQVVHADGFSAVGPGGARIIYPDGGGPHARDLWAISRDGNGWSRPALLTGDSPYAYNTQPALDAGGLRVVFDCGDAPYGAAGTALCEAGLDGSLRVLLTPDAGPPGARHSAALHHAGYAPDGGLVFEADWLGEQLWRMPADGGTPSLVAPEVGNDNSPCVLPDGRIISLWISPAGPSHHQLALKAADGAPLAADLTGGDVLDVGIGCGT
jgi:hypothetical protein